MGDAEVVVINRELSIPLRELQLAFSGSSGPGGQHVNRRATRVTLRFDVRGSPSLSEEQRRMVRARLAPRIDKDGFLSVHVQDTRSQTANREIAVARFAQMLRAALTQPKRRRKTRPSRGAIEQRLEAKRRRALRKQERRPTRWASE